LINGNDDNDDDDDDEGSSDEIKINNDWLCTVEFFHNLKLSAYIIAIQLMFILPQLRRRRRRRRLSKTKERRNTTRRNH